eukprot:gene16996-23272_t
MLLILCLALTPGSSGRVIERGYYARGDGFDGNEGDTHHAQVGDGPTALAADVHELADSDQIAHAPYTHVGEAPAAFAADVHELAYGDPIAHELHAADTHVGDVPAPFAADVHELAGSDPNAHELHGVDTHVGDDPAAFAADVHELAESDPIAHEPLAAETHVGESPAAFAADVHGLADSDQIAHAADTHVGDVPAAFAADVHELADNDPNAHKLHGVDTHVGDVPAAFAANVHKLADIDMLDWNLPIHDLLSDELEADGEPRARELSMHHDQIGLGAHDKADGDFVYLDPLALELHSDNFKDDDELRMHGDQIGLGAHDEADGDLINLVHWDLLARKILSDDLEADGSLLTRDQVVRNLFFNDLDALSQGDDDILQRDLPTRKLPSGDLGAGGDQHSRELRVQRDRIGLTDHQRLPTCARLLDKTSPPGTLSEQYAYNSSMSVETLDGLVQAERAMVEQYNAQFEATQASMVESGELPPDAVTSQLRTCVYGRTNPTAYEYRPRTSLMLLVSGSVSDQDLEPHLTKLLQESATATWGPLEIVVGLDLSTQHLQQWMDLAYSSDGAIIPSLTYASNEGAIVFVPPSATPRPYPPLPNPPAPPSSGLFRTAHANPPKGVPAWRSPPRLRRCPPGHAPGTFVAFSPPIRGWWGWQPRSAGPSP